MKFIWRSYYQFLLVWKQSRLYFLRTSWYDAVLAISRHLKWSDILLSKLLITTAPFFCNHFGTLILRTYTRIREPFLLHLNSILGYNLGDCAYGYSKLTAFRGRLLRVTQPAHAEHRCVLECKLGKIRHSFFSGSTESKQCGTVFKFQNLYFAAHSGTSFLTWRQKDNILYCSGDNTARHSRQTQYNTH